MEKIILNKKDAERIFHKFGHDGLKVLKNGKHLIDASACAYINEKLKDIK